MPKKNALEILESTKRKRNCHVCNNPGVKARVEEFVSGSIELKMGFPYTAIFKVLKKEYPKWPAKTVTAFRSHFNRCDEGRAQVERLRA